MIEFTPEKITSKSPFQRIQEALSRNVIGNLESAEQKPHTTIFQVLSDHLMDIKIQLLSDQEIDADTDTVNEDNYGALPEIQRLLEEIQKMDVMKKTEHAHLYQMLNETVLLVINAIPTLTRHKR